MSTMTTPAAAVVRDVGRLAPRGVHIDADAPLPYAAVGDALFMVQDAPEGYLYYVGTEYDTVPGGSISSAAELRHRIMSWLLMASAEAVA